MSRRCGESAAGPLLLESMEEKQSTRGRTPVRHYAGRDSRSLETIEISGSWGVSSGTASLRRKPYEDVKEVDSFFSLLSFKSGWRSSREQETINSGQERASSELATIHPHLLKSASSEVGATFRDAPRNGLAGPPTFPGLPSGNYLHMSDEGSLEIYHVRCFKQGFLQDCHPYADRPPSPSRPTSILQRPIPPEHRGWSSRPATGLHSNSASCSFTPPHSTSSEVQLSGRLPILIHHPCCYLFAGREALHTPRLMGAEMSRVLTIQGHSGHVPFFQRASDIIRMSRGRSTFLSVR